MYKSKVNSKDKILSNNVFFFFFKQKTAYEMCGRDWSSDVCSSDLNRMNEILAPRGIIIENVLMKSIQLPKGLAGAIEQIGRASCRERV